VADVRGQVAIVRAMGRPILGRARAHWLDLRRQRRRRLHWPGYTSDPHHAPDGSGHLRPRALQEVCAQERGHEYVERLLIARGASAPVRSPLTWAGRRLGELASDGPADEVTEEPTSFGQVRWALGQL
jgi:hypothetical protein